MKDWVYSSSKSRKKNKYLSVSENHVETSKNDNNNSFFFTSKPDTDKNKERLLDRNIWKFEKNVLQAALLSSEQAL